MFSVQFTSVVFCPNNILTCSVRVCCVYYWVFVWIWHVTYFHSVPGFSIPLMITLPQDLEYNHQTSLIETATNYFAFAECWLWGKHNTDLLLDLKSVLGASDYFPIYLSFWKSHCFETHKGSPLSLQLSPASWHSQYTPFSLTFCHRCLWCLHQLRLGLDGILAESNGLYIMTFPEIYCG